jgi:hypothetical protein
MADLVVHLPTIAVDAAARDDVAHGRALFDDTFLGLVAGHVAVLDDTGELIAVYRPVDERLVADVVLVGS